MGQRRWAWLLLALAGLVLVTAACASAGDLELTQKNLAAAEQRLATAEQRLAETEAKLATAQQDLTTTQETLTGLQVQLAATDQNLVSTKGDLATTRVSLAAEAQRVTTLDANTKATQATASAELTATKQDLSALRSQLSDLKDSYLTTRDQVGATSTTVSGLQAGRKSDLEITRWSLISLLYAQWWNTLSSEDQARASLSAISLLVSQTNDSAFIARWNAAQAVLNRLLNGEFASSDAFFQAFDGPEDALFAALEERQLKAWDALKAGQ